MFNVKGLILNNKNFTTHYHLIVEMCTGLWFWTLMLLHFHCKLLHLISSKPGQIQYKTTPFVQGTWIYMGKKRDKDHHEPPHLQQAVKSEPPHLWGIMRFFASCRWVTFTFSLHWRWKAIKKNPKPKQAHKWLLKPTNIWQGAKPIRHYPWAGAPAAFWHVTAGFSNHITQYHSSILLIILNFSGYCFST